jgi:hypothetical protein
MTPETDIPVPKRKSPREGELGGKNNLNFPNEPYLQLLVKLGLL